MKTNKKGDIAQAKVVLDLTMKGYELFIPLSEHGKVDLIACSDGKCHRLQVKYNGSANGHVRRGGTHHSVVKGVVHTKYDEGDFDYYAVYLPSVDKVIYPAFKFGGMHIRTSMPKTLARAYWYEDFLDFTDFCEKRLIKTCV